MWALVHVTTLTVDDQVVESRKEWRVYTSTVHTCGKCYSECAEVSAKVNIKERRRWAVREKTQIASGVLMYGEHSLMHVK